MKSQAWKDSSCSVIATNTKLNCLLLFVTIIINQISSSISLSTEAAAMSRNRLSSVFQSLSGKLTLSPEVMIPEPTDPTAILLQNDQITKLSESIRIKAKSNAAFISCSISSLQTFVSEQEESRGNFPGPVPVVYCLKKDEKNVNLKDVANAGAAGILLPVLAAGDDDDNTVVIDSVSMLQSLSDDIDSTFVPMYKEALQCGLQGVPEIILDGTITWTEDDVVTIVEFLKEKCTKDNEDDVPVALIISMQGELQQPNNEDDDKVTSPKNNEDEEEEVEPILNLPPIPKSLKKQIPILGSVRVLAGENRMGWYISKLKSSGFTGAFLRADCVPGFRLNPDLQQVSKFWSACMGDLKSTKSKNFGFRAKINVMINRDIPMEWFNLQKDVMESGALGSASHGSMDDAIDTSSGDFKGF